MLSDIVAGNEEAPLTPPEYEHNVTPAVQISTNEICVDTFDTTTVTPQKALHKILVHAANQSSSLYDMASKPDEVLLYLPVEQQSECDNENPNTGDKQTNGAETNSVQPEFAPIFLLNF